MRYLRTRYGHQGRRPGSRLDCAGVVVCAYKDAGHPLREERDYPLPPQPGKLRRNLERNFGKPRGDTRVGDAVLMWMERPGDEIHCGLVVSPTHLAHVRLGKRVELARLDGFWGRRVIATYGLR